MLFLVVVSFGGGGGQKMCITLWDGNICQNRTNMMYTFLGDGCSARSGSAADGSQNDYARCEGLNCNEPGLDTSNKNLFKVADIFCIVEKNMMDIA